MKFVPKSSIDNTPALVQVMACRPFGEPMLNQFTDANMRHYGDELKQWDVIMLVYV